MNAGIRRIIERNTAKLDILESSDPEFIVCSECDGHGWTREDYAGLGRYTRTDCFACNGEGRVPNRIRHL